MKEHYQDMGSLQADNFWARQMRKSWGGRWMRADAVSGHFDFTLNRIFSGRGLRHRCSILREQLPSSAKILYRATGGLSLEYWMRGVAANT